MSESSKFHSNLDDNLSPIATSNLAYMSYAVHDFPGQKKLKVSSISAALCGDLSPFSETGQQVLNTNGLSQSTDSRPQSTWKIHPSLEVLLGDFCSELDVNKKRHSINYPSIGEFPSTVNSIKERDSSNSSSFSKLSVAAPEFVPLTPDKSPPSFPKAEDLFTPNLRQLSNPTLAEPESPPGLEIKDPSFRGKRHSTREHVLEIPSIRCTQDEHSSSRQLEERDLISFDPDAFPRLFKSSERSSGSVLSENGKSHVFSSFESTHASSTVPKYGEIRARQCTISPGLNSLEKSVELIPLLRSGHGQPEANNFQGAVDKVVEDPTSEEKQPQPLTQTSSKHPIFKTYAEAANYFYSLLEEQTRQELFELPSVPAPPFPSPPGNSEHCFERPNWAVARNEENDLAKMRQQYCSVSAPTSFTAAAVREEYSPVDRAYTTGHSNLVLSPAVREQVSPLQFNGNGYTEPILQEPRPLHGRTNRYNPEANDSQDSSTADMCNSYSSSNKDEDQIKPYRKASNRPIRGGGSAAQDLEREIDEYHENLRAKANRANQVSSQRSNKSSRNGGGGGGGRGKRGRNSSKRYSNEEQGFDDPVVSGGEGGWGMDTNANIQWGMGPEENGNGPY